MKNKYTLSFFIGICLTLFICSSCSDWLDVKPKTEEEADDKFSSLAGFKSALAGVYLQLSQPELYGREMTFGTVGVLGQEWDRSSSYPTYGNYYYLCEYNFEQPAPRSVIDNLWKKMYEAIANVNTLLTYTEERKDVLGDYYGIIRGEALALKAFIHFDLLRLYAPYDFSNEAKPAIPYVDQPKPVISPQVTPARFAEFLLRDINEALILLKADPIMTGQDVTGVDNGYLANRFYHLNYYAALGLKARICLYAGKLTDAYSAADEVITAQEEKGLFKWVSTNDLTTSTAALRDRTFSTENIFAFNILKLEEYIKSYFRETTTPLLARLTPDVLYESNDDYRTRLYETYSGVANVLTKFWQFEKVFVSGTGWVYPKRDRMPSIRISEMYYIAAEALLSTDINQATEMLNTVRANRGLDGVKNATREMLQEEIGREYYRELIGEGQVFFYHKRLGTPRIAVVDAVYVLPMPEDEIDYGQRDEF